VKSRETHGRFTGTICESRWKMPCCKHFCTWWSKLSERPRAMNSEGKQGWDVWNWQKMGWINERMCMWMMDSPSSPLYFSPTFHTPHFLCTHSCFFFPPTSSLWSNQRSDWRVINWFESNIFIKNINSITVVKLDLFGNLNTEFDFCCLNFAVDRIWAQ
jgi:hypothetical protein